MRVSRIGWGDLCSRCENDFTPSLNRHRRKCVFDDWCDECYCAAPIKERFEIATPEDVAEMLRKNKETRERLREAKEAKEVKKKGRTRNIKKYNYQFAEDIEEENEIKETLEMQRQQLEMIYYYSDD